MAQRRNGDLRGLPAKRNFLGIDAPHASYENASIVIVPAPYERTVSYGKGTARGPAAILAASRYVEFWDEEFGRELCFDHGICTLPSLSFRNLAVPKALERIERLTARILSDGKFVVTLGGEHTVSVPAIRAHAARYPGISILQLDAHADLRPRYEGTPWSHASAMARIAEFIPPERIVQLGVRAESIEEYRFIRERAVRTFFAHSVRNGSYGDDWKGSVLDALGDEVYVTFDVDFLDPSAMPATGTPEPGGFFWDETIDLLKRVGASRRIVGFDVVELAPSNALPFAAFLTAKLVYKLMNASFMGR
ncbi:MAG: agmatinase [Bacteroidota bacterium]|nr:agmatinase [Bacteroidota bacterium]